MAYQTAWFKCHYPREYMAALLTSVLDSQGKVAEYIAECRSMGIRLLPPDINQSGPHFTVAGEDIRFGLAALKGVGRASPAPCWPSGRQTAPSPPSGFLPADAGGGFEQAGAGELHPGGGLRRHGGPPVPAAGRLRTAPGQPGPEQTENLEGQFDLFSLGQDKPEPVELVLRDIPEFSPRSS